MSELLRKKTTTVTCTNCGTVFQKASNQVTKSVNHFCKRLCQGAYRTKKVMGSIDSRTVKAANGCIEWIGTLNSNGYGQVHYKDKKLAAHRVFYARKYRDSL